MTRVGISRTEPSYSNLSPPFGPGRMYPELVSLLGDSALTGPNNHVYSAVRRSLAGLALDADHFGSENWNPLGDLVSPGGRVILKPNFIRHFNPCREGTLESVVTHGSIIRALADYAFIAVGDSGSVAIAEAPQHDCDFNEIRASTGLDKIVDFGRSHLGRELEVIDLRREVVEYREGTIVSRRVLDGDPAGYRLINLGPHSYFEGAGLDPNRFRGADYDPGPTSEHHQGGRHEYLLSETVLRADLVVNIPKIKTHKKTGVTLALKNLVGINGDKNLLPHHCVGSESEGGDEFPGSNWIDRTRSRATEVARQWLARGSWTGLVRLVRRAESTLRGNAFIRSGNWYGNKTTWRMCLDLNTCLYYNDKSGERFDSKEPVRKVLSVADGIIAGEGEGPLSPRDRPLGVVLASLDPIALDLVAVRLMGFDEHKIPKIREAMAARSLRITSVERVEDVEIIEVSDESLLIHEQPLETLNDGRGFTAHTGWRGHLEFRMENMEGQVS